MSRGQKKERTLTKELGIFLAKTLLPDLRARAGLDAVAAVLRQRWEHERSEERTAESYEEWVDQLVEQVGAAWILSCVFVRTLEDRNLVPRRRLAGEGAADSEHYFYELAPSLNARDYLLTVFKELSRFPGTEALLGPKGNPAWRLAPSGPVAQSLLDFFRERKEDGSLRWTFGLPVDPVRPERSEPARASEVEGRSTENSTRFLGDLYQDLSESVRERYALLQTPEFVERFILGLTLDPAIQEFGLEEVRVIDPTCGSGHFLLGAYDRLFEARLAAQPGLDRREHALAGLGQVYGADINPYAIAIARFRLTLAFLEKAGLTRLAEAPKLPSNFVVADSLLYGARGANREFSELAASKQEWGDALFTLEEPDRALEVLSRGYHVVVGNPPYITCKDAKLREKYRSLYPSSAAGKYALAAPFTERFFNLGLESGFVGVINANSFMKREFGKKLIESVLPNLDLTHIIDTSGAYIPGHGTPTVILVGRNRGPVCKKVRAVLGKRGEPETLADPEQGKVWSSIADHLSEVGFENEYVSIVEVNRATFEKHPWSLGGGGAAELKELLESKCEMRLGDIIGDIGPASFIGLDDAFMLPLSAALTRRLEPEVVYPIVIGEGVRDWSIGAVDVAIAPYARETHRPIAIRLESQWGRQLWRYRCAAESVSSFGGKTRKEEGQNWWEWYRWLPERYLSPYRITFAFVATHNHFALDRGGNVFNRSAPVIKLPDGATEEDHLALLGYLNSSTACFWMKQVLFQKSSQNYVGDVRDKPERIHYEFSATGLGKAPVPERDRRVILLARALEDCAHARAKAEPGCLISTFSGDAAALRSVLARGAQEYNALLRRMVVLQEELDWVVYELFGIAGSLAVDDVSVIGASAADPGARPAFGGDAGVGWADLSPPMRELWQARRKAVESAAFLGAAVEQPNFKRPWLGTQGVFHRDSWTYAELSNEALRDALLGLAERECSAGHPASIREIGRRLERNATALALFQVLTNEESPVVERVLGDLVAAQSVPSMAALSLSESGLAKRRKWANVWELQRREDTGEDVGEIPVPPKYDQKDYRDPVYWRLRGKLDVPKERFISYPGAERDDDKSPLIGWAGWDHLQRAQALAALYQERKNQDGWDKERLRPLLAALLELVPWLKQWHNAPDKDPAKDRAGDAYASFVETEALALGYTLDDLWAWRPEERRGRKPLALRQAQGERRSGKPQGERGGATARDDEGAVTEPAAPKKPRKRKSQSKEASE